MNTDKLLLSADLGIPLLPPDKAVQVETHIDQKERLQSAALVRTTPRENDQLMELPLLSRCCRTANSNNCVHVPLRKKGSEKNDPSGRVSAS